MTQTLKHLKGPKDQLYGEDQIKRTRMFNMFTTVDLPKGSINEMWVTRAMSNV